MQNYEKLRQLLCEEEEIRNQIDEMRMTSDEGYDVIVQDEQELELRHILWYAMKQVGLDRLSLALLILTIDHSKPLSSQDEVCGQIYNYLITLGN